MLHVSIVCCFLLGVVHHQMDTPQCVYLPVSEHLAYFQFLAIKNRAAINRHMHIFLHRYTFPFFSGVNT